MLCKQLKDSVDDADVCTSLLLRLPDNVRVASFVGLDYLLSARCAYGYALYLTVNEVDRHPAVVLNVYRIEQERVWVVASSQLSTRMEWLRDIGDFSRDASQRVGRDARYEPRQRSNLLTLSIDHDEFTHQAGCQAYQVISQGAKAK